MFTNDTMKGRKNMINAKKIIASAVFFASLLGSLAFKPTIEKNKPLFEANRALNNLLSVEKYVEADSDKSPLDKTAGLLDPIKEREKQEDIADKVFTIDKEKLGRYINRESNTYSYIDAFKEIQEDLFEGKTKSEKADINQAIRVCSQETIESKLFLNSMFDTTYTSENIEEKMVELRFDDTPSIIAPYNTLDFNFDGWLADRDIDLQYRDQILDGDFSAVPESLITNNPDPTRNLGAGTLEYVDVNGIYYTMAALVAFISAKLGTLFATIAGAIKAFITSVIIPYIGWILAGAIIIGLTVLIILNWSVIVSCFDHIMAWFCAVAHSFASKIIALFNDIANQAANKIASEVFNRVKTYAGIGKWTESKLKNQLNKCLHVGAQAISIAQLIRNNKYVYLGKWANYYSGVDYISTARNNGGIYYDVPSAVSNYVERYMNGDFCTLLSFVFGLENYLNFVQDQATIIILTTIIGLNRIRLRTQKS